MIAGVDLDLVLLAMAIGVAIEAPLGAVNLIVIRASLRSGLAGGLAAASGSIIGEAAFAGAVAGGHRTAVGSEPNPSCHSAIPSGRSTRIPGHC